MLPASRPAVAAACPTAAVATAAAAAAAEGEAVEMGAVPEVGEAPELPDVTAALTAEVRQKAVGRHKEGREASKEARKQGSKEGSKGRKEYKIAHQSLPSKPLLVRPIVICCGSPE